MPKLAKKKSVAGAKSSAKSNRAKKVLQAYEEQADEAPRIEKFAAVKKDGAVVGRVPLAAFVHEACESIQLNCCLSPWCENFGVPAVQDGALSSAYGYDEGKGENSWEAPGKIHCLSCNQKWGIYSNRGGAELMSQFVRKYAPSLFCQSCSMKKLAQGADDGWWDYATPDPTKHLEYLGFASSGAIRLQCTECGTTETGCRRRYIQGIAELAERTQRHIADLHAASFMTVSDYRRSHPVTEDWREGNGAFENPRAGERYYAILNKLHFLAVEWLSACNNQIRYGLADLEKARRLKVEGGQATQAKKNLKKKARLEELDDEYDEGADAEAASPEFDYGGMFSPMPQVQTDTILLSSHTPGSLDSRFPLRLMVSALAPSGYIFLATLDFCDSYNLSQLEKLDRYAANMAATRAYTGREFTMHPHLVRFRDVVTSDDRGKKGRRYQMRLGDAGTRIHRPYHALAHFFALEKIVAKMPELMLVQDGEPDSLSACLWAFRDRIRAKTCHVITSSSTSNIASKGGKSIADLEAALARDIGEKRAIVDDLSSENSETRRQARKKLREEFAFQSYLTAQGANGTKPKKKRWISVNTLDKFSDEEAARMLKSASLFDIDSICNQMRQRLCGYQRGQQKATDDGLSYLNHWKKPSNVQQKADIFAFGKNCLAWHSLAEGFMPAAARLGIAPADMHLYHYCKKSIAGRELFNEKFRFPESAMKNRGNRKKESA